VRRGGAAALWLTLPALAGTAAAQSGQTQAPRYSAGQLACARFIERADADIHGEAGGRPRDETTGRVGRWIIRAAPAPDGATGLEAWFDSLSIWRKADGAVRAPDTDGLIGGRFRGQLSPDGRYTPTVRPFVPDEVAEFAGLRDALADLLPPLPPMALTPGAAWHDDAGLEIERLGDSTTGSGAIQRYRVARRTVSRDARVSDSLSIPLRQTTIEAGEFAWDDARGVLSRTRTVTIDTDVPAAGAIRVPVRSRVVQRLTLERLPDDAAVCG